MFRYGNRAVVRHGGGHHQHIQAVKGAVHGFKHLLRRGHRQILGKAHRGQGRGAVDQGDLCAPLYGGFGQRIAHLAGGMVGQVAHRVQRFLGGAGGHRHPQALHILGLCDLLQDIVQQHLLFGQPAAAHILAGKHTALRGDHRDPIALQGGQVVLGDGVFQHAGVHGRGHQLGAAGGQQHGGQHIVRNAVGHLGDDIGGGRCH